LKIICRFQ